MTANPQTALDADQAALAEPRAEANLLMRRVAWVLLFGAAPVAAWLGLAPLAAAVVAPAYVKVDLDRRPVQHGEGGVVREVLVRDGQHVRAGQPLLVLGDVAIDADRQRLDYRVAAERAGVVRLEAEQSLATVLRWPEALAAASARDPRIAAQLGKEQTLFAARRAALTGQTGLLRALQAKVGQEITALRAQISRAEESLRHQRSELETSRGLGKDGFLSLAKLSQMEAAVADYGVKLEERRSEFARAEQRLIDTDLRVRALENEYRQQASDQLKVSSSRLTEILQEHRKTTDAAQRQTLVAPVAGQVMNLRFTSPGGVVGPRETVADIVPSNERLLVQASVRTEDVTRIAVNQAADVRFTAFVHRTSRLVAGKVVYVSPDRIVDGQTGAAYYTASIEIDASSLAAAGPIALQAGMPAEVYIKGEERSALQYLIEPVTQVLRRAAREQ